MAAGGAVATLVLVAVVNALVGACIGLTGIAGFLLPIFYVGVLGLAPVEALALSFAAFLVSGVLGTPAYRATGDLPMRTAGWLALGSLVGAAAGTLVGLVLPAEVLTALLYVVVLGSGTSVLVRMRPAARAGGAAGAAAGTGAGSGAAVGDAGGATAGTGAGEATAGAGEVFVLGGSGAGEAPARPAWILAGIGFATAVVCAATGAGGPVLVVPILMLLGLAPRAAVGTGLLDSVAIAIPTTIGYFAGGGLSAEVWPLVVPAVVGHGIGVVVGSRLAPRINPNALKAFVAVGSVAVALWKLLPMLAATL